MMSEAFVLHFLDDLDAKLNFIGHLEENTPESGYQWTDFQRVLERFLYVKGRPISEEIPADSAGEENSAGRSALNSKQQQLF
jgi:3'-5' exoribonuclease